MSNFDLDKAINRFDRFTSKGDDIEVVKKNGDVVYLDDISDEQENMIIDDNSEEYVSEEYEEPPKNNFSLRDLNQSNREPKLSLRDFNNSNVIPKQEPKFKVVTGGIWGERKIYY